MQIQNLPTCNFCICKWIYKKHETLVAHQGIWSEPSSEECDTRLGNSEPIATNIFQFITTEQRNLFECKVLAELLNSQLNSSMIIIIISIQAWWSILQTKCFWL